MRSRSNWNLEVLVFDERGKPEYPEKNLSEQGKGPTTNSTHIWRRRRELNPGHLGGRRALSPLGHTSPLVAKVVQNTGFIPCFAYGLLTRQKVRFQTKFSHIVLIKKLLIVHDNATTNCTDKLRRWEREIVLHSSINHKFIHILVIKPWHGCLKWTKYLLYYYVITLDINVKRYLDLCSWRIYGTRPFFKQMEE